jgi:putative transposase
MQKVAPSERFPAELVDELAGVGRGQDPIETVGRLGARLILQQALEDEVSEFLGRARDERAEETVSHRDGYEPKTVMTTSGALELERPRVRDASKLGFESRGTGQGRGAHLCVGVAGDHLVLARAFHQDIEAALAETFDEPITSRGTVSRICEDTRERYRRWCARRLGEHGLSNAFAKSMRYPSTALRPCSTPNPSDASHSISGS